MSSEGNDDSAKDTADTKRRPGRVHFVSFLRTSVPPDTSSPSSPTLAHPEQEDDERAPLLGSDDDPELAGLGSDDDDTRITFTLRGVLVTIAVLLAITGVCAAAVFLRVAKHIPSNPRNPIPPSFPYEPRNKAYLKQGTRGAVASEDENCSQLGVQLLKEGGNAVDAAIATNLCIGTVNMFASGIGGGGFAIIRIPGTNGTNSTAYTIDFRETAPALSNETMFGTNPQLPRVGGLAVGVPGELRGLAEMHKRWGRLPWKRVVEPAAVVANGWNVTAELAKRFLVFGNFILEDPDWRPVFAPAGRLLREGDPLSRLAYSRTLHAIAEHGAEIFYSGNIAKSTVAKIRSRGGIITLDDIANYKPLVRSAVEGSYRGRKVYTTSAPTSGPVLLHMLNILEHYNLVGEGRTPLNMHRIVEAMKFGFAARTRVADPAFLDDHSFIESILTKEYARIIQANITDDRTHEPSYYNPMYDVMEDHGTTHTSVVDSDGMAVGITSTVNLIFGSQVHDPQTGIIFNDEMDDFATYRTPNGFGLYPSPYNYPQPGKRPLSSMAPTIMEQPDGHLHLILGGSGGSRIFGSIVQVILNMDWGMDVSAAIEWPRVHNQLFPHAVDIESEIDPKEIGGLREKGHLAVVSDINLGVSEVQAVHLAPNGTLFAASDSRKHGVAAAY